MKMNLANVDHLIQDNYDPINDYRMRQVVTLRAVKSYMTFNTSNAWPDSLEIVAVTL